MEAFVPYVTFMKHAQKVTKGRTAKTRPVLSAVLHKDNYVAVTDSHRLYKATGVHEGESKQVDPVTGLEVNHGEYPNIERLISDSSDAKHVHKVDVIKTYEAVRAIEIASRVNKATDAMKVKIGSDLIEFKTDDAAAFSVSFSSNKQPAFPDTEEVSINIKYLKEAIHTLKDAKVEEVTVEFFGRFRPMQLRAGNFTAIILPIRTTN